MHDGKNSKSCGGYNSTSQNAFKQEGFQNVILWVSIPLVSEVYVDVSDNCTTSSFRAEVLFNSTEEMRISKQLAKQ
jgi:hypothetical protein